MNAVLNVLYLVIAITFETCGDAYIRKALRGGGAGWFPLGAALLMAYGTVVSFPTWNFSRTMGVYIAVFFVISQVVARVVLHESVRLPTLVGGVLIVGGGLVILFWSPADAPSPLDPAATPLAVDGTAGL